MPKPPVREILRIVASPRMLRFLLVLVFAVLVPTIGANLAREFLIPRPVAAVMAPLDGAQPLNFTTDGSRYSPPVFVLLGSLPDPVPQQKTAPCAEDVGEREIRGACWLAIKKEPPCPPGKAFEDRGVCYMRVLHAARLPTSGGSYPTTIAE